MIVDLSHPIIDAPPCSFALAEKQPRLTFEEGDTHGTYFITSALDHLPSNLCTHIDFPGHLAHLGEDNQRAIGAYELDRFVGDVAILDMRHKLGVVGDFFDKDGLLAIAPTDGQAMLQFLEALDSLCISQEELDDAIAVIDGAKLDCLLGVLFMCDAASSWQYRAFDSWAYRYFYNPYLSQAACESLLSAGISFVGIDAFQLEHPIINFRGDELPVVLHPDCRSYVSERLTAASAFANHAMLLGSDVLIYENLNIPAGLTNRIVAFAGAPLNFQLPGMTDNALTRPYVQIED